MMKKITEITLCAALIISVPVLNSCSKDSAINADRNNPSAGLIKVIGENAASTLKTTLSDNTTQWIATNDKVGIYSPEARTTYGGSTPIVNAEFTAVSSGTVSDFTGTMYWSLADTPHNFYSYYPYAAGSSPRNLVPVSLASLQTQSVANNSDHVGVLDFMVATPVMVPAPDSSDPIGNSVNFRYNHLFAILEFHIKGTGSLKAVKLVAPSNTLAFSGGTIDITQAIPASGSAFTINSQTGTTKEVVLTLTNPATLTSVNTDTKVYMVINPGTQTGNCFIGISADGVTWKYISKTPPDGGFLRSSKYVVAIDTNDAVDVPEYPESSTKAVLIAGLWWAPVNVGYATDPKGLLFQWHRKYGQAYGVTPPFISGPVSLAVGNDPSNANSHISISAADWCTPSQSSWNMATEYNPCPSGWRIPVYTELQALRDAGSTWQSTSGDEGRWFGGNHSSDHTGSIFIPAAGARNDIGPTAQSRGSIGWIWSTNVAFNYFSYRLGFSSSGVYPSYDPRGYGFSVRCVQ